MTNFTEKILTFLKTSIEKSMKSYDRFTNSDNEEKEGFDFQKHHMACKQGISHLESLLKLYEKNLTLYQDSDDKKSDTGKNLQSMINEACMRIKKDNEKHK